MVEHHVSKTSCSDTAESAAQVVSLKAGFAGRPCEPPHGEDESTDLEFGYRRNVGIVPGISEHHPVKFAWKKNAHATLQDVNS